jgi:hypothetical protein
MPKHTAIWQEVSDLNDAIAADARQGKTIGPLGRLSYDYWAREDLLDESAGTQFLEWRNLKILGGYLYHVTGLIVNDPPDPHGQSYTQTFLLSHPWAFIGRNGAYKHITISRPLESGSP